MLQDIETVSFSNFLSYGDYITTIPISTLGQCLIRGEVLDDDENRARYGDQIEQTSNKSNGAGKSCIPSVIQWCLFGRTMHSRAPGDKILNWYTGKPCMAQIKFKGGDQITRMRSSNGVNELMYVHNGEERKFTSDTLGTSNIQQAQLARTFGLDWDILNGSVFFTQYGQPWLEMNDQIRKRALERLLHVDRFSYYANSASQRCKKLDELASKQRIKLDSIISSINNTIAELERLANSSTNFDIDRQERYDAVLKQAENEAKLRDNIELPQIDKLKDKWAIVKQISDKIVAVEKANQKLDGEIFSANRQISAIQGSIQTWEKQIADWQKKSGQVCITCEQTVPEAHTLDKIVPIQDRVRNSKSELNDLITVRTELQSKKTANLEQLNKARSILDDKKPKLTIAEAESIHRQWKQHDTNCSRYRQQAKKILAEQNPHDTTSTELSDKLVRLKEHKENTEKEVERFAALFPYYNYINKVYTDRDKIKSYIFEDHIPYINSRLKHYLDVFGLDIHIELTKSLGITSNLWGYQFESGGERKRTDVAIMFAIHDLHEQMYGQQSNIVVLDEVDGRMDDDGIDALINIIKNDIAPKVETVLIISHKTAMHDVFTNEILVRRKNRFSSVIFNH